jgi:hypothetical protein
MHTTDECCTRSGRVSYIEILAIPKQPSPNNDLQTTISKQQSASINNVIRKAPRKMTGGYEVCSSFSTQKALPVDSLPALG